MADAPAGCSNSSDSPASGSTYPRQRSRAARSAASSVCTTARIFWSGGRLLSPRMFRMPSMTAMTGAISASAAGSSSPASGYDARIRNASAGTPGSRCQISSVM